MPALAGVRAAVAELHGMELSSEAVSREKGARGGQALSLFTQELHLTVVKIELSEKSRCLCFFGAKMGVAGF